MVHVLSKTNVLIQLLHFGAVQFIVQFKCRIIASCSQHIPIHTRNPMHTQVSDIRYCEHATRIDIILVYSKRALYPWYD